MLLEPQLGALTAADAEAKCLSVAHILVDQNYIGGSNVLLHVLSVPLHSNERQPMYKP